MIEDSLPQPVVIAPQNNPLVFKIGLSLAIVVVLVLGVFTGNKLVQKTGGLGQGNAGGQEAAGQVNIATKDVKTFKDYAKGTVKRIERDSSGQVTPGAEGTHLLIREDAAPANLISSVVDLDKFVGKKVEVWGETQKAERAAWLLDVGRIQEVR